MGPPSYMRYVVDRNVVMRSIHVIQKGINRFTNGSITWQMKSN